MNMTLIAAVGPNWEMGKDGKLPWPRNDADMRFFRDTTMGGVVAMGGNTFRDDLKGKPLDGRINVVLTNDPLRDEYNGLGAQAGNHHWALASFRNLRTLCHQLHPEKEVFIIGGWSIYSHAAMMGLFNKAIITRIPVACPCDCQRFKPRWLEQSGLHCTEMRTDPRYPGIVINTYTKTVEEHI